MTVIDRYRKQRRAKKAMKEYLLSPTLKDTVRYMKLSEQEVHLYYSRLAMRAIKKHYYAMLHDALSSLYEENKDDPD